MKIKAVRLLTFLSIYDTFLKVVLYTNCTRLGGNSMSKGTVKWFNNLKGFGFIIDETGNDIFVHYSGVNMDGFKTLQEGQEVEFEVVNSEKGPQAVNVTRI